MRQGKGGGESWEAGKVEEVETLEVVRWKGRWVRVIDKNRPGGRRKGVDIHVLSARCINGPNQAVTAGNQRERKALAAREISLDPTKCLVILDGGLRGLLLEVGDSVSDISGFDEMADTVTCVATPYLVYLSLCFFEVMAIFLFNGIFRSHEEQLSS